MAKASKTSKWKAGIEPTTAFCRYVLFQQYGSYIDDLSEHFSEFVNPNEMMCAPHKLYETVAQTRPPMCVLTKLAIPCACYRGDKIRRTRTSPRAPVLKLFVKADIDVLGGNIELKVTDVNAELGEIGGVFVHKQPSDTDLGSKAPKEVLLKGSFFATVN